MTLRELYEAALVAAASLVLVALIMLLTGCTFSHEETGNTRKTSASPFWQCNPDGAQKTGGGAGVTREADVGGDTR